MKKTTNHPLLEHIVTLLNLPEVQHMGIDRLLEDNELEQSELLAPHNIRMAYESIRFMDAMPGGFFIYYADGDEQIIYANKAALRIFYCDTTDEFMELTKHSFKGLVHPDDLASVEQSIQEQITQSQYDLDYVEYRIIRKDGEIRWIDDYGHFLHSDAVGDVFYVFFSDMTEKKNRHLLERELLIQEKKKSEKKMHALQNVIDKYNKEIKLVRQEYLRRLEVIEGLSVNYESILYVDLDEDSVLPYRLSSRTEHQFDNKYRHRQYSWYFSDYTSFWVHPDDHDYVFTRTSPEYMRKKLADKRTYYLNYRVLKGDELQYIQLRIVNVGHTDPISQIVMGYRRVDKEVQSEMEQKLILKEALTNANLAIVAKNTFLSNMSHDMRTPLNAILGFTSIAQKNIHNPVTLQNYLNKINIAGGQLLDLIDKVLKVSWTESNNIQITSNQCKLSEIIRDVYQLLFPQASEKQIRFLLQTDTIQHDTVQADASNLRQLLLYIANNAVTYTQDGGTVTLCVQEKETLPDNYIIFHFIIKDTGIGISEKFIEHIFEPFEREQNTTYSGIYGTGLGLTIAKNIADLLGGTIDVVSVPDKGSTFTVILPLRVQGASGAQLPENSNPPQSAWQKNPAGGGQ